MGHQDWLNHLCLYSTVCYLCKHRCCLLLCAGSGAALLLEVMYCFLLFRLIVKLCFLKWGINCVSGTPWNKNFGSSLWLVFVSCLSSLGNFLKQCLQLLYCVEQSWCLGFLLCCLGLARVAWGDGRCLGHQFLSVQEYWCVRWGNSEQKVMLCCYKAEMKILQYY